MARVLGSLLAGLVGMGSIACSTAQKFSKEIVREPITAEWVVSGSSSKRDDYRQSTSLRAPAFDERIDREGSYYRVHLRGVVAKNGAEHSQLYVATHLVGAHRNFRSAHDQDGIELPVNKVSRKKQCGDEGCVYYEHFTLSLPPNYIDARRRSGMDVIVAGPGGQMALVIPPAYVEGYRQTLLAARASESKAKAKTARVSFCKAKYGGDPQALAFCQEQARASYGRLKPSLDRLRADAFTAEARTLEGCMKKHNGRLGIDWMMVEHCFDKARPASPAR